MNKKFKAIALIILFGWINVYANQITGQFTFSSTGFQLGGIPSDPEEVQQPAYFIFDIQRQEVKVFNFLDAALSHIFERHRVFQVSRRNAAETISNVSELFDFENTVWAGSKVLDFGDGMVFYRDFVLNESGDWWASEYGGLWGAGTSGFGEIIDYLEYTPELASRNVEISQRAAYIDIRYHSSPGFSHTLYVSYDLSEWLEVPNAGWNRLDGNSYVSSLFKSFRREDMPSKAFYKVIIEPLTFDE